MLSFGAGGNPTTPEIRHEVDLDPRSSTVTPFLVR